MVQVIIVSGCAMKKFIKENIVLTLGISLPLLFVLFFIVAGALPKYLVADPKYDFFFSEGVESYIEFKVQQQKLYIKVNPKNMKKLPAVPRLYRYIAATGNVQEIAFKAPDMSKYQALEGDTNNNISANIVIAVDPTKLPSKEQAQDTSKIVSEINKDNRPEPMIIPVAEAAEFNINNAITAPDGYQFYNGGYNYRGDGLLFFGVGSSYRNNGPLISKSGKSIPIHYNAQPNSYYYLNFIGWIIP